MTRRTRSRHGASLDQRVRSLEVAVDVGRRWLPRGLVDRADHVVGNARARLARSVDHTVVALAGSTGSGKSSLFNTVVGSELSPAGVVRPTTARPTAAVWDAGGEVGDAATLLDWLEVDRRTVLRDESRDGLVLLDLPDHDSVAVEHRVRAERLVERADLLLWVVDPQKYADAVLHERYLRPLAGHSDVVVVVLNQIDRLGAAEQAQCLADLRRLVTDDGLRDAVVLGVSARTGQGVDELRELLDRAARRRAASTERLVADVRAAATAILDGCGLSRPSRVQDGAREELLSALEDAARVDTVVDAVRGSAELRARAATGWPVTRWVGRFRADPLRRLNLHRKAVDADLARTSLPPADPAMAARTHTAVRTYVDTAAAGAPDPWVVAVRHAVRDESLPDALDQAVARTELDGERRPRWWSVVSALQWGVLGVLVVGLAWLGALALLAFVQLPVPSSPDVEGYPIPTLMVVGSVVGGVLVALVCRVVAAVGAHRAARRAARRLRAQIELVARAAVVDPVEQSRLRLDECRAAAALAGR
ncbi:GTPase [Sanguibacter suaedae]|uniref:GTPase n=1 Tax=Sanguibacter suaedae TaxID=2795737 RepID=UPI0027DB8830|nr:GTPase [Sanguibacter suaedae]